MILEQLVFLGLFHFFKIAMMAPFKFNVPMFLTWMRILLIPFVIGIFYIPNSVVSLHERNVLATVFFLIAAITDALDGFLA